MQLLAVTSTVVRVTLVQDWPGTVATYHTSHPLTTAGELSRMDKFLGILMSAFNSG